MRKFWSLSCLFLCVLFVLCVFYLSLCLCLPNPTCFSCTPLLYLVFPDHPQVMLFLQPLPSPVASSNIPSTLSLLPSLSISFGFHLLLVGHVQSPLPTAHSYWTWTCSVWLPCLQPSPAQGHPAMSNPQASTMSPQAKQLLSLPLPPVLPY